MYVLHTKSKVKKIKHRFYIKKCQFRSVKLTKTADPDKDKYICGNREFDSRSDFSFIDGSMKIMPLLLELI